MVQIQKQKLNAFSSISDTRKRKGSESPDLDRKLPNDQQQTIGNVGESREKVEVEELYNRLINEAPYIPGDKMELCSVSEIPWAKPHLMKEGINFAMRNFFPLLLANTAALMLGFSVKPDSVVLLRSGKFNTAQSSLVRFLSTSKRISTWFMTDITDVNSEGFKNIKAVRKLHNYYAKGKQPLPDPTKELGLTPEKSELAKAIRDDLDFLELEDAPWHLLSWNPPLQFSQLDVAMTQFGFFALIFLFPQSVGAVHMESIEAYIHYWAVLGRLMGLEDRFNLALHVNRELLEKLHMNIGIASVKSTDDTVVCLQHYLIEGLSRRLPLLTVKSWVYEGLKGHVKGYEGKQLYKLMDWRDKLSIFCLRLSVAAYQFSFVFRVIINLFFFFLLEIGKRMYVPKGCPM